MEDFNKGQLIDIGNKKDIDVWCTKFNCEDTELIKAVLHIGPLAARVNDYLELNRKKKKKEN
jgi:hypothetical protein